VQRALCLSCMYCWLQGWRSQLHITAPASQNGRAAQRQLGRWGLHLAFYESHLQSQHTPSIRLLYLCAAVPLGMLNVAVQCQTRTPLHDRVSLNPAAEQPNCTPATFCAGHGGHLTCLLQLKRRNTQHGTQHTLCAMACSCCAQSWIRLSHCVCDLLAGLCRAVPHKQ
jgi:hypothetical protein